MFINDVGENSWEEINEGLTGSNYGWPNVEGIANTPVIAIRFMHTDMVAATQSAVRSPAGRFTTLPAINFPSPILANTSFQIFVTAG